MNLKTVYSVNKSYYKSVKFIHLAFLKQLTVVMCIFAI